MNTKQPNKHQLRRLGRPDYINPDYSIDEVKINGILPNSDYTGGFIIDFLAKWGLDGAKALTGDSFYFIIGGHEYDPNLIDEIKDCLMGKTFQYYVSEETGKLYIKSESGLIGVLCPLVGHKDRKGRRGRV